MGAKPGQTEKPTETASAKPSQTEKPTETASAKPGQTEKPTEETASAKPGQTEKPTETAGAKPGQTEKPTETASAKPGQTAEPTETTEPNETTTPTVSPNSMVKLNKTSVVLYLPKYKTFTLIAKVDGKSVKANFKSSNPKIVKVNAAGKLTAVKSGKAVVKVTVNGKKFICKVTVKKISLKIKPVKRTLYLKGNKSIRLKTIVTGPYRKVRYKSSNKNIVKVNGKGKVTAVRKGKAKITVTANGIKKKCQETSQRYERLYQKYFEEQAGILARELQEGEPCPVCGSCSHPKKAVLSGGAPKKEQVERAKAMRDQAEKERTEVLERFQAVKGRLESEQSMIVGFLEKEGKTETDFDEKEAENALRKLTENLKKLQSAFKNAQDQYQKLTQEKSRILGQAESKKSQLILWNKKVKDEEEYFRKEFQKQNFQSQEEYEQAKQWIKSREAREANLKKYETALLEVSSRYETLKQQTEGKQIAQIDKLEQELMVIREKLRLGREKSMTLHTRNEINRRAREALIRDFSDAEKLRSQYEMMGNLSRTANGNLSGSVKLDFETYVQRQYFRQIIHAANVRLARMTGQEFILQCRDIGSLSSQAQAGLDLDVYDLVNDSVRDVKTLSGGESFMASLSMALGLADIVQNTAGAVSLETMFVDEGFGSLDDMARERAIQILKELAGEKGLVGIISHVNELKEQIEWQLEVKKTEHGSHVKWNFME